MAAIARIDLASSWIFTMKTIFSMPHVISTPSLIKLYLFHLSTRKHEGKKQNYARYDTIWEQTTLFGFTETWSYDYDD